MCVHLNTLLIIQFTEWIKTKEESSNDFIRIGLTDRDIEGTFVWESGRALSQEMAAYWKKHIGDSSEPNSFMGQEEDCVAVKDSYMYEVSCSDEMGFVCQKQSGAWSLSR